MFVSANHLLPSQMDQIELAAWTAMVVAKVAKVSNNV